MNPIIQVEHLHKKFSRNMDKHKSYAVKDLFGEIIGLSSSNEELRKDEYWAVKDLSFKLYEGESIAFVGRNGCGKTTTLKMLAGLIKPDKGKVTIHGRVQALIALGAGFNPRLSGRDNIFNSAAVQGFSRKETQLIVDEIVDFAELEDFIDSPVQTYSSGMHARLGFAVAVHLKPDVLLIDEILAVGDFSFQNKCFAHMQKLKKSGVSIILISHSHTHIIQMCDNCFWLEKGNVMGYQRPYCIYNYFEL